MPAEPDAENAGEATWLACMQLAGPPPHNRKMSYCGCCGGRLTLSYCACNTVWGKTCLGCIGRALPLPELGGVQIAASQRGLKS